MARAIPRWVKVTGIVGGFMILLLGVVAFGGVMLMKSSLEKFEQADRSFDAIAERYGEIASYRPDPHGRIPADRLEAFLVARERFGERRQRTEEALTLVSSGEGMVRKLRGTAGLVRHLASFHRERNEALMEAEMGLGEYYYLYALTYYAWLDKSPADGPSFEIVGEGGYLLETIESEEEERVRTRREEQARLNLNRLMRPVLEHQLEDLEKLDGDPDVVALRQKLEQEIAAMDADPRHLPWEDGLPAPVAEALTPYRERLDRSYSSMCNAIEIGLARRST